MKVNIFQITDASFVKFSWWSNWIDVSVFDFSFEPYLVQMSVSRRNKKKFRCINITGNRCHQTRVSEIGDLTQMECEK